VISFGSLVCWSLLGILTSGTTSKFTMYSQPIELKYGEVYNKMQSDGNWSDHKLPQDVIARYASGEKVMAIKGFTLDVVRKAADGSETQVKLNDHYLHHYVLYFGGLQDMQKLADAAKKDKHVNHMLTSCHAMNGMGLRMVKSYLAAVGGDDFNGVSFGSAAGAEYRHNPQEFQPPYRLLLHKPEVWLPTFHVISTKGDNHTVSPLLECHAHHSGRSIQRQEPLMGVGQIHLLGAVQDSQKQAIHHAVSKRIVAAGGAVSTRCF